MFGICVECSHERGMGNLFRSLNIIKWLEQNRYDYILMINNDARSINYLETINKLYVIVDLWDYKSNWEERLIKRYRINIWINDRMATDIRHSQHVKALGVKLCSFDDTGTGAQLTDYNFCSMVFENTEKLCGKKVFTDINYMILNPDISKYRKYRTKKEKVLVTLGGSDTYGVTKMVATAIKDMPYSFTVVVGYCCDDLDEINDILRDTNIVIEKQVPSLIEFMSQFDLAITGGGITPFEAIAQGMPCIIIANEHHEEQVGEFFSAHKCAEYLGYYKALTIQGIKDAVTKTDVKEMSRNDMKILKLDGVRNVMEAIING